MKKNLIIILFSIIYTTQAQKKWTVPKQAEMMTNPIEATSINIAKGEKIFKSLCASCHGKTGMGDVVAMQSLNPKPTNFTTDTFQNQTDGTIYWKLSEGRGMMAAYKNMLSEEQRWQLVNYLRSLKKTRSKTIEKKEINRTNETTKSSAYNTRINSVDAFPFTNLINAKTTHIMPSKGFGLTIQHRFGTTKFDSGFITNFMGLDLAANIRFAFEIPISQKMMLEVGRTRYGKFYDIGGKYLAVQQTKDNKLPFSLAIYENLAITTEQSPSYSSTATFDNGKIFDYKFYHRLYYDTQLILSRKFSNKFSAQIAGEFIWRNLAPYKANAKEKNYIIAFPISLRYKIGLSSAIDFEIMPNSHQNTLPISLGYEVASSGNHVFQITVTNSDRFLSQNLFTQPTIKYDSDGFILGFNLTRYF